MKKKKINNLFFIKKIKILEASKKILMIRSWDEKSLSLISKKTNISANEINLLFPNAFFDLIIFSLDQINIELERKFQTYNILRFPLHLRIKKILMHKFNLMNKNKKFYNKIFFNLLLPSKNQFKLKQLYKSVDIIWYIAADNSTDFNFYTKRMILAGIYIRLMLFFFNNNDLIKLEELLDKDLKRVLKIPKLKAKFKIVKENIPNIMRVIKNF